MDTSQKIVVIGNGMVGHRFCDMLLRRKNESVEYRLEVFGKEIHPAYDRVNLSKFFQGVNPEELYLSTPQWYKDKNIQLHLGDPITDIDRDSKSVRTASGYTSQYDKLIFATGSTPFVPPIPGVDEEGVFVYRTFEDLQKISAYAQRCKRAVVIGGGLLGLEAVQALQHLNVEPTVIELADFLMSQQLDPEGASLLAEQVKAQGIQIELGRLTEKIEKRNDGTFVLYFRGGEKLETDMVIFSVGIRPNSDLAEKVGLACAPAKGIIVDSYLKTNDDSIWAVGECVRIRGKVYGLLRPGFDMVDAVIGQLFGLDTMFKSPDMSTRLKMLGVDVISLGDALEPQKEVLYRSDNQYRKIVVRENVIIGALGVGEWDTAGKIQTAIQQQMPVTLKDLSTFEEIGTLFDIDSLVASWPNEAMVCNCMKISKGTILEVAERCCQNLDQLIEETEASTVCGSCKPLIEDLLGVEKRTRIKPDKKLIASSIFAFILVFAIFTIPGIVSVQSVQGNEFKIWSFINNNFYAQISGFTLLGLTLIGLLLPARKRVPFLQFGSIHLWRFIHAFMGILSLTTLIIHTGFSFGDNLNAILMTSFCFLNVLGCFTGLAASFEFFGLTIISARARQWRPIMTVLHIITFWPFPILITFHILQTYYF
ncbi:MAG: FAD-dependent oxidoreductase [Lentisphaeria bacterium]|nr:FAD-dependent oxidoreductase [Lentisphaeria bacterium]